MVGGSMTPISWWRHEPARTATGYRLLDWLTHPYWVLMCQWRTRQFWRLMAVGDQTWKEAQTAGRQWWAERENQDVV